MPAKKKVKCVVDDYVKDGKIQVKTVSREIHVRVKGEEEALKVQEIMMKIHHAFLDNKEMKGKYIYVCIYVNVILICQK